MQRKTRALVATVSALGASALVLLVPASAYADRYHSWLIR